MFASNINNVVGKKYTFVNTYEIDFASFVFHIAEILPEIFSNRAYCSLMKS